VNDYETKVNPWAGDINYVW